MPVVPDVRVVPVVPVVPAVPDVRVVPVAPERRKAPPIGEAFPWCGCRRGQWVEGSCSTSRRSSSDHSVWKVPSLSMRW